MTRLADAAGCAAADSIGFLLAEQFSLVALAAALEALRLANQLAGHSLYRWQTLSLDGAPLRASNGMWITPDGAVGGAGELHGLILCGSDHAQARACPELERCVRAQARSAVFLGALGSGRCTLAQVGLREGYPCSTGRHCVDDLQRVSDHPVVERAAGSAAGLELMLRLIAGRHGQGLVRAISETLAFELPDTFGGARAAPRA